MLREHQLIQEHEGEHYEQQPRRRDEGPSRVTRRAGVGPEARHLVVVPSNIRAHPARVAPRAPEVRAAAVRHALWKRAACSGSAQ